MKYSKKFINKIILVQRIFRSKLYLINYLKNSYKLLYTFISSIIDIINDKFNKDIIDQNELSDHLLRLDNILHDYLEININAISIFDITPSIFLHYKKKLNKIYIKLKEIVRDTGMISLNQIIELYDLSIEHLKEHDLLKYFTSIFIPINVTIYNMNIMSLDEDEKKEQSIVIKESSIIELFSNIINKIDNIDIAKIDKENIKKLDEILFTKIEYHKKSVTLSLFGCRLYIKIKKNIYVFDGYFKTDQLNLYRNKDIFKKKNNEIQNTTISIPIGFKEAYIEQITIRDYILCTSHEIILQCNNAFNELNSLKSKTISSLVKEFLTGDFETQRKILTLFLLTETDTDTQYLAYLMYDMISNETYMLKPQPLAEQVFKSLHWTVQKKFKIAINKVEKYTQSLMEFNENDIPYEKRICLIKAPEYIKSKAMDKLKEINNRSNDSSVKAQQYLDGLLKIPFGIYVKEDIINYLSSFRNQLNIVLEKFSKNTDIPQIKELIYNKNYTSRDISIFFDILDNNTDIQDILNYLEANSTVKEYKKIIKIINNYELGKNIAISNKSKEILKKDIIQNIQDQNTDDYISYLANNINIKPTLNKEIIESVSGLKKEWKQYQDEKLTYIKNVRNILDEAVYGHNEPKNQIERIIAQWINGDSVGYCFGFEGPPGTGKTSIAKKGLTKCLADKDGNSRPFSFIPIGGSTNGSTLEGHCYTYVGSTWGRIVDVLMESKCMNPIIFIDELDKISNTEHGKELIGILTHMTDSSQNDEFIDKYFAGIKIDLSQALIIFSYNDPNLIDRILLDRIHRIKFKALTKEEKFHVCHNHLLPEIYNAVGIKPDDITFSNEILEFIIENYTYEAGARKLREKLFEIIRELNLRSMYNTEIEFPFAVTQEFITKDIFSEKPKMIHNKISIKPRIGLVNGLYATGAGLGGITVIETFEIPSDNKFSLELTGQQGDVMKESMKVARTVAWNILPKQIKKQLYERCEKENNFGIHIHCPEGGTPKDGPSAGGAITLAIISLLTKIPVKNTVGITGEIDLNGSIRAIGGLESKVDGAKKAGVTLVLCPEQNSDDVERIRKSKFSPISENFEIKTIKTIWELLDIALCDNDIDFINYLN